MSKLSLATVSLAGCFGCHMSLLDLDEEILEYSKFFDFQRSPLTDIKSFSKKCDVGLVEGGVCNEENVEVLHEFRKNCKTLVSVGECAIMGGLPALRNDLDIGLCLEEAYSGALSNENPNHVIPRHEDIPRLLDKIHPCHELVDIDFYLPGCPPSAESFRFLFDTVLQRASETLPYRSFKYD